MNSNISVDDRSRHPPVSRSKEEIQEDLYAFPYHWIPGLDGSGRGYFIRELHWGLEYLTYQLEIKGWCEAEQPSSVLDVGCGEGFFLALVRSTIPRRVGVEASERALRFARAFEPGSEFVLGSAEQLDEQFDVVTCIEVLEHVPDDAIGPFLRTLAARAKPNGRVIVCVPTTNVRLKPKHYRHYDIELLTRQVEASGAPLTVEGVRYSFRPTMLYRVIRRLSVNDLWTLEIKPLRGLLWKYVCTSCRAADSASGAHLIVSLRKAG